ncbi:MAG: hypothetical protein E1N59_1346 [Puniceicoccaceae bacterium 5H]|nr:MAG: hypothetical protein E1N59_1346 [Puniceicoccaceae bacterium 5H]
MSHPPKAQRPSRWRIGGFLLLLVLACVGIGYLTADLASLAMHQMMERPQWKHDQPHGHRWLHDELGLTDEEAARIDVFEADYRQRRRELETEFDQRMAELAELIRANDSYTPEVTHAVHALHAVHGELQQLAIEHYYQMLSVLPPEKQQRLRDLAVEALSQPE